MPEQEKMAGNLAAIVIFSMLSSTVHLIVAQAPSIDQFANVVGFRGQSIQLFCRVTNQGMYGVYWFVERDQADDLILGLGTADYVSQPRFKLDIDSSTGYHNLTLIDLTPLDAGRYECLTSDGVHTVNGMPGTLEVVEAVAPPAGPSCHARYREPLSEGGEISLTCLTASGGRPESTLTWYNPVGKGVGSSGVGPNHTVIWRATPADDGAVYDCRENHPSLEGMRSCTVGPLAVLHTPVVAILPSSAGADIGDSVTLTCSGDSNPSVETIQWMIGNETVNLMADSSLNSTRSRYTIEEGTVNGDLQSNLTIASVRELDYALQITCIAWNVNSSGNASVNLSPPNPPLRPGTPGTADNGIESDPLLIIAIDVSALGGLIVIGIICLLAPHLGCLVCEPCRRRRRQSQLEAHVKLERRQQEQKHPVGKTGAMVRTNDAFDDEQTTTHTDANNIDVKRAGRLQSISSKSTASCSTLSNCVVEMDNTINHD
ncbi:uncharacterized protein LOC110974476 [Acanthaster planci]|uniref:Uncharacterized protein LOC110974476 n=1 Tax=Acanthaster planci TaxID=133434 RepID=A0A8B7XPA7_ACAPL|nr:uncharacterized protein LOC110974476 [Acanthaster planci]